MQIVKVLLPHLNLFPLTYYYQADDLEIGSLVVAPLKNKELTGVVWEFAGKPQDYEQHELSKLKTIISKLDYKPLSEKLLKFYGKFAFYNLANLSSTIKMALPVEITSKNKPKIASQKIEEQNFQLPKLDEDQKQAMDKIANSEKNTILLEGVTGSGKTEIYFNMIADILKNSNGQVVVLLPEIALTQQIIERFKQRFNFEPAVWHSSISPGKRRQILRGILTGSIRLVIGARSALLLPFTELESIIVDEEHDPSYKQETLAIYNARDMAVLRGYIEGAKVILGTATPSIESFYNASIGKYEHIFLASRYGEASMPETEIVDMRSEKMPSDRWLSEKLKQQLSQTLLYVIFK